MDEQELYDLYGLSPEEEIPTEDGAREQEITDPADSTGVKEQEVTDPAEETAAEDAAPKEGATPPVQTREERARNAAARRQAEQDAAVSRAVQEANDKFNRALQAVGIPNPYTGKTFQSLEELEEYKQQYEGNDRKERMENGNVTEEDIRAIVGEMPEVKAAAAAAERARAAEEAAKREAFDRTVDDELSKIRALDPSVNTLEDIVHGENGEAFIRAVKEHNMNFYDAFRFANMDKLAAARQEDARREEAARHSGKSHLTTTSSRGSGGVYVPAEEMAMYKSLNPDATEAEIRRHFGDFVKK